MNAPPPRRAGMSAAASILLVVGIVAIVGAGAVLAGYLWLRREVTRKVYDILDSGEVVFTDGGPPVLVSPPSVKAALAGP